MNPAVQEALSADIHQLGDLLGATIRRLAGEEAFQLEEEVRAAVKELRANPSVEEARRLRDRLGQLELSALRTLIRAFSIYFDLINLAEQRARVRALRVKAQQLGKVPMAESPEAAMRQLADRGIDPSQLEIYLRRTLICPVFTAHPSEARRRTILEKLAAIARVLDRLASPLLSPAESEEGLAAIAEEVETFWLTETIRKNRPSVLDEVRQGLGIVEERLFEVVPRFYRRFETVLKRVYPWHGWQIPPFLRFGTWIGGDRDGHPNVTHTVTAQALRLQQETVLNHYVKRVDDLWRRLSHSDQLIPIGETLRASIERDAALFPPSLLSATPEHEPYRAKCRLISAKLQRTLDYIRSLQLSWGEEKEPPPAGVYFGRQELLDDLTIIADDLRRNGSTAAATGAIQDMIRLVEVFGVHLLSIDLRQHSARHTQALDEIFREEGVRDDYAKLTPEDRLATLVRELDQTRPLVPTRLPYSDETNEVVLTFRTTATLLEQQCPEALGTYIISSTTEPAHMLEVLVLAREAGLFRPANGVSRLDIVPLFEALEPLRQGPSILQRLFELPVYRRHLSMRADLQEVMIGYSDSSKESGSLQSAWALYRAQSELVEAGRRAGVAMQMFHGRGGAIGRGGGPANRAILAQPSGTVKGRLRMTEQGEVITDRYGHPAIAERHLEQVLNAVLLTSFPEGADPAATWSTLLDQLAASACRHYRALVYETPEFLTYFEQATPIEEIAQFKIGSRPSRRSGSTRIENLRAIPWVFSWMQSRHTLPGWYGLGSALSELLQARTGELATLQEMYRRWPFWRTLIDNAQMILAKADPTIARLYADLVEDQALAGRIFDRIADEYRRTVEIICRITGQKDLLDQVPILRHSIQRRNPYVDALSFIQLAMLKRLRGGEETSREQLLEGVFESINGIASGLKNTG